MYNGDRGINYPKESDLVPEGIPFVNAGDLQEGRVNLRDCNKITREKFNRLGGAKIQYGDILYCLRGTLGKNAYVDNFDEGTVASSLVDIRPKNIDAMYLFTILNSDIEYRQRTLNDEGAAQPNLSARNLAEFDIPIPSLKEQEAIGTFFLGLYKVLSLHQRKLEKLKILKKAMLEKMFPKNGEKVPEIRFSGFTEDWEQRKFSDLYEKSSEKNDGSIGVDRNITVASMQFKTDVRVNTVEYLKTYYTFRLGDIAFEGHQSKEFRFGRFVENDIGDGIVSHIFAVFRPMGHYDLRYWKYAINNERLMQRVLSHSTKASTMMHDLVEKDFLNELFLVPSVKEQRSIGKFLFSVDRSISLHQRKPF